MELQWARKKGGKVGKEMEQKALELREKELDGRCRAQRQIELGRSRRYRDFLERELYPLFLEEYGSLQAIELRLDDDEDDMTEMTTALMTTRENMTTEVKARVARVAEMTIATTAVETTGRKTRATEMTMVMATVKTMETMETMKVMVTTMAVVTLGPHHGG
jgi:hypothetical protein